MSVRKRSDSTAGINIAEDGSILSRVAEVFKKAPVRMLIGLTVIKIADANTIRAAIDIFNYGTATIFIGFDDTVTTSDGMPMIPYTGKIFKGYKGEIWGISTVADTDIRVLELNDEE